MLVLSRRESEKILVPDLGITLEVISIKGNTVKLGINAPREIRVIRGELADRERNEDDRIQPAKKNQDQPLMSYLRKSQVESTPIPHSASNPQATVKESRTSYQVCI